MLRALCSRVTPRDVWEPTGRARNQTRVGRVQGKRLNPVPALWPCHVVLKAEGFPGSKALLVPEKRKHPFTTVRIPGPCPIGPSPRRLSGRCLSTLVLGDLSSSESGACTTRSLIWGSRIQARSQASAPSSSLAECSRSPLDSAQRRTRVPSVTGCLGNMPQPRLTPRGHPPSLPFSSGGHGSLRTTCATMLD